MFCMGSQFVWCQNQDQALVKTSAHINTSLYQTEETPDKTAFLPFTLNT